MSRKVFVSFVLLCFFAQLFPQKHSLAQLPPMGWMSWNYFADNLNEKDIMEMADAMVSSGMSDAGYKYIFIDDGWQCGRTNRNELIPDPKKFPSGIKALADYVHGKGLKLGIYSDAAQLTCAGYTASLGFEEQDAHTFASWGIDYLKYDYCGAPADSATAKIRYKKMADALRNSGRDIVFGICEWGGRQPWKWGAKAGGQLWRTTGDVRDKWKDITNSGGWGILDIMDVNKHLASYAGSGRWNDMDMLVVGLNGKKGPSGDLGGIGCTYTEYQTQMSLWCMMCSPLAVSNDIRTMDQETKRILLNKEVIALNQDSLGLQCRLVSGNDIFEVFVKQLAGGDYALAILNRSDKSAKLDLNFQNIGLKGKYTIRDLWKHENLSSSSNGWKGALAAHETKIFRLTR